MKLINFKYFEAFNKLRNDMDAPLISWDNKSVWQETDSDDLLKRLSSSEGIEVGDISEISILEDGTFGYNGQKVLVYIRDQYFNPRYPHREYKFHISTCSTIESAFNSKRKSRFVVASDTNGKFSVYRTNRVTREVEESLTLELHVCKNCLAKLAYKGYNPSNKKKIYNEFSLPEFFELYGGTKHTAIPDQTDISAPKNRYSPNHRKISELVRKNSGWVCNRCGIDLGLHKHLLDTHHINGEKSDNRKINLEPLCIRCHANMAAHIMKSDPRYKEFMRLLQSGELK